MQIGIFKTNIRYKKNLKALQKAFEPHPEIIKWSVDTEDIDKVLRVELTEHVSEKEVIDLVQHLGLVCELLEN